MIVDSSALLAIIWREQGFERLLDRLVESRSAAIGAPTLAESGIVLASRLGASGQTLLSRFVEAADIEVLALGLEHWPIAVQAFLTFGKGRHAAALNFGDCLTYAIARTTNEPLLCVSDDFTKTDLLLVS